MRPAWLPLNPALQAGFATDRFVVRPLRATDALQDWDAVMEAPARLRGVFGPGSDWPPDDLSLAQDWIDLAWHEKEFQMRTSFAWTVTAIDGARVLGCAYLFPATCADVDAEAYQWVRPSLRTALDAVLDRALRQWLAAALPALRIAWPGRDRPWDAGGAA
ncbi:MAG: GNAT family N-acetyltransferase [Burkholderiales bacterium]|jgi:hypothetical protein|nr:GNAT family N-acetyltransferase [Burkholderiales bacterium]